MHKPFFSIVLPTYNRLYSLKKNILTSLNAQNFDDFELTVVDDGSTDGTNGYFLSKLFTLDYPKLSSRTVLIHNEQNLGSPAARNLATKNVKGEWIFMVEDDIELEGSDFLARAKVFIKELGTIYKIISPRIVEKEGGHYNDLFDGFCKMGIISKEIYLNTNYRNREYNSLSTHACSFINKEVFTLSNYPDLNGMAYREESDFYIKATNKGIKIAYLGDDLKIFHYQSKIGGQRAKQNNAIKKQYEYIVYHYTYLKRNFDFPKIRILFFIFVFLSKQVSLYFKLSFIKKILVDISL
jgi:glycosyltransferase involved in cell wall biosynthesis